MDELIISVFYKVDNFCKEFNCYLENNSLPKNNGEVSLKLNSSLSLSEIMTICIVFHLSGYRTFKQYYIQFISKWYKNFFPHLVSYNRFVELMPNAALPTTFFVYSQRDTYSVINFVDSTTLNVCGSHRIQQHKGFK